MGKSYLIKVIFYSIIFMSPTLKKGNLIMMASTNSPLASLYEKGDIQAKG